MTPFEKLNKANDDYHEAVDEILMDENVPVSVRAKFGGLAATIFNMMIQAHNHVVQYYEE